MCISRKGDSKVKKVTSEVVFVHPKETRSILKTIWHRKHRWLGYVLKHENFLDDSIEGKMIGKATLDRKRMEFLHDIMEGRDYGQLKDLISDRIASEKVYQKPAGNSRRLKKKRSGRKECKYRLIT